MPGRLLLSGWILDEEAAKVMDKVKAYVKFATGQCDAWKNIAKTSLVASMINVEYTVRNVMASSNGMGADVLGVVPVVHSWRC